MAAGAFLDVGFQVKRNVVVALMAAALFGDLGREECIDGAVFFQRAIECFNQRLIAPDPSRFEQAGIDGNVFFRLHYALAEGAHGDAGFQTDVPQQADEGFDRHCRGHGAAVRQ